MQIFLAMLLSLPLLAKSDCQVGTVLTFSRTAGYAPQDVLRLPVIYSSLPTTAITAECYNRCRGKSECEGFAVDYENAVCYETVSDNGLVYSPNYSYFRKVCLPVRRNCTEKAWSVDVTPGYALIGLHHTLLTQVKDRWTCVGCCLNASTICLSANYDGSRETCTLSSRDKWTDPDSFVPTSRQNIDYLENQCIADEGKTCWEEPLEDWINPRADLQVMNISEVECGKRCEREQYFRCRGYSWIGGECLLGSDPGSAALGPTLNPPLATKQGAVYVQPVSCLPLSVRCEERIMRLLLDSPGFRGRVYVQERSDSCTVRGVGSPVTILDVPLPRKGINPCDVLTKNEGDRTVLSVNVVVQKHLLIQTVNDRVVRASCIVSRTSPDNVTLEAGFSVKEPGAQTEITGSGGEISARGRARMTVVDVRSGKEAKNVRLGDPLQLRIELQPPLNSSDVRAGHLVASSGTDSVLLLDWRGCPPIPSAFPSLREEGPRTLVADFRAFRFPSSPLLLLDLVLTVCPGVCPVFDCGGRRRRSDTGLEELPLRSSYRVRTTDNGVLSASLGVPDDDPRRSEICFSFLLGALLGLLWFLLQCVILAVSCSLFRRRRTTSSDRVSLDNDFPPRHVTWADNPPLGIPSKELRLNTPMDA